MARRHGATDEELETLADLDRSPLPAAEKAAVRFAERMTIGAGSIGKADVDALLAHWDAGQVVEIACVAGTFNYLNRFAEAMGLWPTRPGEGGPDEPDETAGEAPGPGGAEGASA